jgi:hypothetical protein
MVKRGRAETRTAAVAATSTAAIRRADAQGNELPTRTEDESDEAHLARAVKALYARTRARLAAVANAAMAIVDIGRGVRLLPILFLLSWPVVLPWLLFQTARAVWFRRRPVMRALLRRAKNVRRNVMQDLPFADRGVDDVVLLRESPWIFSVALAGPPLIMLGFYLVWRFAGL